MMDETPPPLESSGKKKESKRKPSIILKRRSNTAPVPGILNLPDIDVDESREEDDKIAEAQVCCG